MPTVDGRASSATLLGPDSAAGARRFAEYALPPLSRIACELMQARLRRQATVFGLGDDPIDAYVDRAARVARIDADRMTTLNDALTAALVDDAVYRLRLMRTFVRARRRLVRVRRGVEAALDLGALPTAGALRAFFDATTTYHELGALKFAFPHDLVRARFTALLAGGNDAAGVATTRGVADSAPAGANGAEAVEVPVDGAAYDSLRSPPGASLFVCLEDARIRLALARATDDGDRYRLLLERWATRSDLLSHDDLAPAGRQDRFDPIDVLDRDSAATAEAFGSAAALRAEVSRRRARRRKREQAHAHAVARFRAAIAARRDERLWAIGMLQLLHAMAAHEDRNRVEKMRFLRAWERTCGALGLPSTETGSADVLEALRSPPRAKGAGARAAPVTLAPLFTRIDEHAGRALVARERARLATAAALGARFRERPGLLPDHLVGPRIARVEELTGNLCDLIVRCTFDTGESIVGKAFLPVVKERPTLAFHPALAQRGQGIDRRMNLIAERIAAAEATWAADPLEAGAAPATERRAAESSTPVAGGAAGGAYGDPFGAKRAERDAPVTSVCVPRAYGYDADWRIVWLEDAAAPGAAPAARAASPLRPLARTDWAAALPALARALAAVHAPGLDPHDARSLHDPLRAAYLVAHPARCLAPYLDSAGRVRRWRRFIALDAGARRALIHGDLCPKNVVRDGTGTLWLLDFDRANIASAAYDVGVFAAHLLIEAWVRRTGPAALRGPASPREARGGRPDDDAGARFVALYMEAAGEDDAFALRVALHAALALAYRAATPDFIGVDGSNLQDRITQRIGVLLDRREPWRALAHTF